MSSIILVPCSAHRFVVTVGESSFSYGLDTGFGSVSPSTFREATVVAARTVGVSDDFYFTLSGVLPQAYFKQLRVAKGDGTYSTFSALAATSFSTGGGNSNWRWAYSGFFIPWDSGDTGQSRDILVDLF